MTVSVSFNGSVIDTADNVANWTAIKITSGGQAPTAVAADAAYEGTNNVTCRSDNKRVYMYTDIGAGNELDFTPGGNAEGDLFYIWVNFLPSPLLALQSEGGLGIFMSSGTPSSSNYALWYFEGRDTYTGGWIRLAVDPNKTPSIDNDGGGFDPSNVRYFGAFAHNNQGSAKYDNFVVDQCAHGQGLIVTGTSTLGLVEELIADEESNRHGIVTALNSSGSAAELKGTLILGDDVGTAATAITDEDSKLFAAEPIFYETTLKPSIPLTAMGLSVVGNATGDTSVIMGKAVGTDQGRNGIALVGNSTYDISFDRDDGAVETSDFYGCSFENMTGTINLDGNHDFNGNGFSGCGGISIANGAEAINLTAVGSGQINLNTSGLLTDALVINSTASASVLAQTLNGLTGNFTSDGSNHAVELTALGSGDMTWNLVTNNYDTGATGSPITPTNTGNEDLYVNVGSGTITINVAAGATTPSVRSAGATVNVVAGLISLTISAPVSLVGAEIAIYDLNVTPPDFGDELAHTESHNAATFIYSGTGGNLIGIQIMLPGYVEFSQDITMPLADGTFFANLQIETNS